MRLSYRIALCLAATAIVVFTLPFTGTAQTSSRDAADVSAVYFPSVQLKHWQNTPSAERYAFLVGFLSMLEMERAWQGPELLPVNQSTVATWVRGLSSVTLRDMDTAVNQYIATHPNEGERSVVEVLGRIYVRPKMTRAEREMAGARYEQLRPTFAVK